MLMLLFALGAQRYALEGAQVVEVAPAIDLQPLPHAPSYVAGLGNYRGQVVPVIDLCQLVLGRPCQPLLSTRLILVQYEPPIQNPKSKIQNHFGLLAERVTDTARVAPAALAPAGIRVDEAPYLGEVMTDDHGMIRCVRVEHLLPEALRASLFAEGAR
jgi:chemotaxis-related protein WspB